MQMISMSDDTTEGPRGSPQGAYELSQWRLWNKILQADVSIFEFYSTGNEMSQHTFQKNSMKTITEANVTSKQWEVCPFRAMYENAVRGKLWSSSHGWYFLVHFGRLLSVLRRKPKRWMLESVCMIELQITSTFFHLTSSTAKDIGAPHSLSLTKGWRASLLGPGLKMEFPHNLPAPPPQSLAPHMEGGLPPSRPLRLPVAVVLGSAWDNQSQALLSFLCTCPCSYSFQPGLPPQAAVSKARHLRQVVTALCFLLIREEFSKSCSN